MTTPHNDGEILRNVKNRIARRELHGEKFVLALKIRRKKSYRLLNESFIIALLLHENLAQLRRLNYS